MDNNMLNDTIIHLEDCAKWILTHQEAQDWLTAASKQKSKTKNSEPAGPFRNGSTFAHCFHDIILLQKTLGVSLNSQWYGTIYSFLNSFVLKLVDKILTKYLG